MNKFEQRILADLRQNGLYNEGIDTIQVNVGLVCNQQCVHCHVKASPYRTEIMDWVVMQKIVEVTKQTNPLTVDITGGAPEMNPHLKMFVTALKDNGHDVMVRTNLTILFEPGMEDFPEFYRDHEVDLIASMPSYIEEDVCAQRGEGVYEGSISALKRLNEIGYGIDPHTNLDLVYNPNRDSLPGDQSMLEKEYKKELMERFEIQFSRLLTITNIPVGRFQANLQRANKDHKYLSLLMESYNPRTLDKLMCRHQINIGYDGSIYDCDFNYALNLPVNHGAPDHINDFNQSLLEKRRIVTGEHCFGCTAGHGSSCGGSLLEDNCDGS